MHRNRVKPWKPKTKRGSDSWFFILLLVAALLLVGYYLVQRRLGNNLLATSATTPRAGLTATPTRSTEDFIILAQQAARDGHFREAVGFYDQAGRRRPNDVALHVQPALLLAYSGQYAKAEQRSRHILQSNPKNVLARVVLCYALQYERQLDAGMAECQTATTDDPNSAMAWAYLAEAQADKNDCGNARTSAQQAVDVEPENVDALHKLGYYYEVCEQNYPTALEYYQRALALAPNMPPVLMDIGRLQLNLTNTAEATKAFQHIIEMDDQNAEAYSRLAIVNMTIGEYSESLKLHDRAVELEPGRAWFWANRGWLNYRRFFFPEAAADYAKAVAASKVSQEMLKPIDYLRYGYALTEANQCDQGRAMLAKAVEMAPGDATFIDTQTAGLEIVTNNRYTIRTFEPADQAALAACDFTYTTQQVLSLRKTPSVGLGIRWELTLRDLEGQHMGDYGLADYDWELILQRGQTSPSLLNVAEFEGKPIALLDASFEDWNETAKVWNLYVDAAQRGQGLGRQLVQRAAEWARQPDHRARAVVVETQTTNVPACQFYRANGFELSGIDDHFYSNDDINAKMGLGEVALFWYLALQPPAKPAKDRSTFEQTQ